MMLKAATILVLVAARSAIPLDEVKNIEGGQPSDLGPQALNPQALNPQAVDPQAAGPLSLEPHAGGPQALESNGDGSDLKPDSSFWGYYGYPYPAHRRSYHAYRPSYYYNYPAYHSYPAYQSHPAFYWNSYW